MTNPAKDCGKQAPKASPESKPRKQRADLSGKQAPKASPEAPRGFVLAGKFFGRVVDDSRSELDLMD